MRAVSRRLVLASLFLVWAHPGWAQTADDVIEKSVSALGGRAAFAKVTSQSASGTITLSTPGGDVSGPVEVLNRPSITMP